MTKTRVFLPSGWFGVVAGNLFRQRVDQRSTFNPDDPSAMPMALHPNFWTVDVTVGYKLPGRYGSIVLDARNVADREFELFERSIEDTVIPARVVTLTANFTY